MTVRFRSPSINLYSRDIARSLDFYAQLGFVERFRTPTSGDPVHVELVLDGFTLGIATAAAAHADHGIGPTGEGHSIELVVWSDNVDAALVALGGHVPVLSPAHDFLDGRLRAAWIADPDGNPLQIVQRRG